MTEFSTEGLRTFKGVDEEVNYYVVSPAAEDIRGADWEYSKMYTKSLVEGITTSSELTDILMRRGIIGPEFDQRSDELAEILMTKIDLLEKVKNSEEKQALAIEVAQSREELFQWKQRLNAPLANTCEQIADDARLEYITSRIIVNDLGEKIWTTFNDYLVEKAQGLAQKARFEVMLYLQGLDSDFLDQTPEAQAIKEVEKEALAAVTEEIKKEAVLEVKKEATKKPIRKTTRKVVKKTAPKN